MNILFAIIITLIVYPTVGTLLFALIGNLRISTKIKILIMTFGHPLLTAVIIWFGCSTFNSAIAEAGVLVVAGSFLRVPFSDRKYLSNVVKESGTVTIEYFSELLKRKTISWPTSEITGFTKSSSENLIEMPSELIVTALDEKAKFTILDKTTKVSP